MWSVDPPYVDKILKYLFGIKYLLEAVDWLSVYLKIEPLNLKYTTETPSAFQIMIKHNKPEKVWIMMEQLSSVHSKPFASNAEFIFAVRIVRNCLLLGKEINALWKILSTDFEKKTGPIQF